MEEQLSVVLYVCLIGCLIIFFSFKVSAFEVEKNRVENQTPSDTTSEFLHGTLLTFFSSFETLYVVYYSTLSNLRDSRRFRTIIIVIHKYKSGLILQLVIVLNSES